MTADELIEALASRKVWGQRISIEEYNDLKEETNIAMWNEGQEDRPQYMYDGATSDNDDDFEWFVREAREILNGTS